MGNGGGNDVTSSGIKGLGPLLAPDSVAILGASDDPGRIGGRPVEFLQRFGFGGRIYPVNPNRRTVQGLVSYPDMDSLPEVPDVVLVALPGQGAVAAVEQSAAAGVGAAIVLSSGFGEASPDGRRQQRLMTDLARAGGMRLMGPNCQGLANFANGTVLGFSTMFLEQPPMDGPIAVVSQSGSMSQVPYGLLRARGHGVRYCAATGNEADVTAGEIAAVVASDPGIRLVLLYLETVRDGAWLAELGRVAAARSLPVVVLKAGSTPAGQVAAASHTGALANEDRVVSAFLERAGIYRAADLPDLMLAVELYLRDDWIPSPAGPAVVSNSGASCVQCADAVVSRGGRLAELAPATVERIAAALPAFATPRNPVDLTAALLTDSTMFGHVLDCLGDDQAVGSLVVALPVLGQGYDVGSIATAASAFASRRPTVVVAPHQPAALEFSAHGLPVFVTEAEAVAALTQWTEWGRRSASARSRPAYLFPAGRAEPGAWLDEQESLALLGRAGVPVVQSRLCVDAEEAVAAWAGAGGAVVLKGCSDRVAHKSELGLVAVGLTTEADVRDAYGRIRRALRAADPDAPGVVVAPLVAGLEMMIGGRIDPVFGPVVLVGGGGLNVEAMPDTAVLVGSFEAGDVVAALARLRMAPLLTGVRGQPPADVDSLARAAVAAASVLAGNATVAEFDLNPVMVGPAGHGCTAVDARVLTVRLPG